MVTITIHLLNHGNTDVSPVWEQGGLAVYETVRLRPDLPVIWSVAHASSGMALVQAARTRELAIAVAEQLLALADWTQSAEALRIEPGLRDKVMAVLRP